MRLILRWLDVLKRTTVDELPAFCAALTSTFQEVVEAANAWAQADHTPDGTHAAVRFTESDTPTTTTGAISVYWDGTNLKYLKPDGTSGNIV